MHANSSLMPEFNDYMLVRQLAQKTKEEYLRYAKMFLVYLSDHDINNYQDVTRSTIIDYLTYLKTEAVTQTKGTPLSRTAIELRILAVKQWFAFLVETERIMLNPASDIKLRVKQRSLPRDILSLDEINCVLSLPDDSLLGQRDRLMLLMLYTTGIRSNELILMDIDDIDFSAKTILIHGKGGSERFVPLHPMLIEPYKHYLKNIRPHMVLVDTDAVFISRKGNRLCKSVPCETVKRYAKMAGISKRITTHSLRHTCATHLLDNDVDLIYIKELLGHVSIQTTTVYARVTQSRLRKQVELYHPLSEVG